MRARTRPHRHAGHARPIGWQADTQFALLLFGSAAVSAAAIAAAPSAERRLGQTNALVASLLLAAATGASAFRCRTASPVAVAAHSTGVVIFTACVSMLRPGLQSLASSLAPAAWQGRSFGVMNSMRAFGAVVGSLGGAELFEWSLPAEAPTNRTAVARSLTAVLGECGGLPFDVASLALVVAAAGLCFARRPQLYA